MTDTSVKANPLQEYRLLQFAREMLERFNTDTVASCAHRGELFGHGLIARDILGEFDFDELDVETQQQVLRDLQGIPSLAPAAREAVLLEVARQALGSNNALDMEHWHSDGGFACLTWHLPCGTSHCIAGWATTVAREAGVLLENEFGTRIAGAMLLGPEAAAHFFDSQEGGERYLRSVLQQQQQG